MRPLSDLVVVERGDGVGIRYAGRLLGQLGAEIWRPDGPGPQTIGYLGAAGEAYAAWLDQGKSTGTPRSPNLIITDGDGVQEDDDAIVASLSWFTPNGPYADWQGTDAVIQALAGHVFPFGPADGPPAIHQGDTPQILGGVTMCIAVLAALIGRRAGAGPQRVETSIFEAMMCLSDVVPMVYSDTGVVAGRRGVNRYYPTFPGNCWQAADGWVGITTLTPPQWRGLCELIGHPELASDPDYATTEHRITRADKIDALFAPRILEKPVQYWVQEGQALRVPFVAAPRPAQLLKDPHWIARGSFTETGGLQAPRLPYRIMPGGRGRKDVVTPTRRAPLRGLRIMDLTMGWSGPLATRHLGALGADIIKVESRAHPDWWRGWNGPEADPTAVEKRRDFTGMNTNKRGILLDLTSSEDLETAKTLAGTADALVENYATGVIDKLGLGHKELQQIAPGIVSVSMALFGAYGPNATFRGYGSTTDQASGLPFVNGAANWPPAQCHVAIGDAIAGLFSAIAALAGIWGRSRYGGAYYDLSQVEALFQLAAPAILAEQVTAAPVPRDAVQRPGSELTAMVAGAGDDAWLVIDCLTTEQVESLKNLIGKGPDVLDAASKWALQQDPADAAQLLQAAGIPAAPVQAPHLLDKDPHLVKSGYWDTAFRPFAGTHLVTNAPYHLDGARPAITRPAPVLGQHSAEVLAELNAEHRDLVTQ